MIATAAAPLPATIDRATLDRLADALAASKQPSTRRVYRLAWGAWCSWCEGHGASPLPAAPELVAAYLARRNADGAGTSTLRTALAAIKAAHELAGHPSPTGAPIVKTGMQGFTRQATAAGATARQTRGLTGEALATVRCCIADYFVGSPRDLLGLFRRRIAWDAGAIRDTSERGEGVEFPRFGAQVKGRSPRCGGER